MCDPLTAIVGGAAVLGGIASSKGAKKQAQSDKETAAHQAEVERHNAQVAEWQAQDAIERGQVAVSNQRLKTASVAGSQRARFAARGLAVDEGSPLRILMDTEFMGDVDARTIADNAEKEAWMLRENAQNAGANASFLQNRSNSINPSQAGMLSLLGSAGNVASTWYTMSTRKAA